MFAKVLSSRGALARPVALGLTSALGLMAAAQATAPAAECAEGAPEDAAPKHVKAWQDRWDKYAANNVTPGFQQPTSHRWLLQYEGKLARPNGEAPERFFVPLCGKTPELLHLSKSGIVAGVECVQDAIDQFASENGLVYDEGVRKASEGTLFRTQHPESGKPISIAKTDFFNLDSKWDGDGVKFDAAWDRAANVAVDPAMRADYGKVMAQQMAPGGRVLLVAFEYDQSKMSGPPFALREADVRQAYEPYFSVEQLERVDVTEENKGMKSRGVDELFEALYFLVRNDTPVA